MRCDETQNENVRRLETSAPGPPDRHSSRFVRGWEDLSARLDAAADD